MADDAIHPGARVSALCEDNRTRRALILRDADTFFSLPARVSVRGRTVTGFLTRETVAGYDTPTPDDPAIWKFTANRWGANASLLTPKGD